MESSRTFLEFLRDGVGRGGFETDDVLAAVLPLMEQVRDAHERGCVAPLDGIEDVHVEQTHLWFEESKLLPPSRHPLRLISLQQPTSKAVDIVGSVRQTTDVDEAATRVENLLLAHPDQPIKQPIYRVGYRPWECAFEHHDELTDIFALGLILGSLACGLDFTERPSMEAFVTHRQNLFALNPRINPVVASAIVQMTELDRHRRTQDLGQLIERLRHYRDQVGTGEFDISQIKGFKEAPLMTRRKLVQSHLRDRLFEISRRNRLIHYRATLQSLNLTLASVPLLLNYRNIQPSQLFIWRNSLAGELGRGTTLNLGNYLRFEDAPYLPGVLDGILGQARRDRAEFGFSQLRLVIAFLRWNNLKESPDERIHSPLLLLPVELTKKKGVRDVYQLRPTSTDAEVNPALRHHLKQLYDLNMPEAIELTENAVDTFYDVLVKQIQASEPGVSLQKMERPQIQLVHDRARQRLNQYRRRLRVMRPDTERFEDLDYSYDRESFHPLGLQIFLRRVRPSRSPFSDITREKPEPRLPRMAPQAQDPSVSEVEKQMYEMRQAEQTPANPYVWEFDLCNLTLGNFNYRKMSLVRDYSNLLETDLSCAAFDRIFSLDPRQPDDDEIPTLPIDDQYLAVVSDPTQISAIGRARRGDSYIIQGPPGTGKSQTITNLIADYVARGKRVLFVCQKRAAIDVVFHRLEKQGLGELCCLIHDSQTDKREFILNLKHTYENWLKHGPPTSDTENRRADVARQMNQELGALRRFSDMMQTIPDTVGIPLRRLLQRLVELRPHQPKLSVVETEGLPDYRHWLEHGHAVERLASTLKEISGETSFARHPLRHLSRAVVQVDNPVSTLLERLGRTEPIVGEVNSFLGRSEFPPALRQRLDDLIAAVDLAIHIEPLAQLDLLLLLNPGHERHRALAAGVRDLQALAQTWQEAVQATANWREKLPSAEVPAALALAQGYANNWFARFSPGYWRFRKMLRQRYDFSKHAIPPNWEQIIEQLDAENRATTAYQEAYRQMQQQFGVDDPFACFQLVTGLHAGLADLAEAARALLRWVVQNPSATQPVIDLAAQQARLHKLEVELAAFLAGHRLQPFEELPEILRQLRENVGLLPDIVPCLMELQTAPEEMWKTLSELPLGPLELESGMAVKSLADIYRRDRLLNGFDGRALGRRIERLGELYVEWLPANAECVRARVRRQFLDHVQLSAMSVTQLNPDQKEFKRAYAQGRRELEHEFGKTMRYRSIRDLATGETGLILRDLKPVWLMSPLSVSDTLPLDPLAFDVVIFDEASQVPVEEAVPAAHRAQQVIVVGDEMQLPPTNFFSAAKVEEENLLVEEEGRLVEVDLTAESFLTMAARNLPSTLLGWHYRSRSESLISFSNASFYQGQLLTVPDCRLTAPNLTEIRVTSPEQGGVNIEHVLGRSISFHFLENGIYEDRSNADEARYIAETVRALLARDTGLSIGIVAFSEAQQGEIESALAELARRDSAFDQRLEAEYDREQEGEFCGLFVKNLENVQGDERDVIILSICYGYDRDKRMLMNFGPINQRGGEKRLNVIFSRARRHMVVVSSIHHHDITNEYNDGANCLRNFLEYAACMSTGDVQGARRLLAGLVPVRDSMKQEAQPDVVVAELAAGLRSRGYEVDVGVGQSDFRCDLAVRLPGEGSYRLGVLVDTDDTYRNDDLVERYLTRPGVLRAFDWHVALVLTKDWHHRPEDVLRRLERALNGSLPEEPAERDPAPQSEPEEPATPEREDDESVKRSSVVVAERSAPVSPGSPGRYFEFIGGSSRKFWEVTVEDRQLFVRFGRIGSKGQTQLKEFDTVAAAEHEAKKLIAEKTRKGYVERSNPSDT